MTMPDSQLSISRIKTDFPVSDFENEVWDSGTKVHIDRNWDGSASEDGRNFSAVALWSDRAICFRFVVPRSEPLVVSSEPRTDTKTAGLWERDVCEVFIAADLHEPRKYFEFEVAPTGEWLDLAIDSTSGERVTDWDYQSGMEAAARIEPDRMIMVIKIPWKAFGRKPEAGDVWLGNIFRCVGKDPDRGYLAWQPTLTKKPNFHVPEKFGEFVFE